MSGAEMEPGSAAQAPAVEAERPAPGVRARSLAGVEVWTGGDAPGLADALVHERFEAAAAAHGGAVAVVCGSGSLTYAELNLRADRLAGQLAALGVGPEARVAICMERAPEAVVSVLAVLKAGGAYVPLDPAYPPERLAWMLADSGAAAVLTQAALRGAFPGATAAPLVCVDALPESAGEPPLPRRPDPRNLAYLLYTSGSTGTPKGVGVEHRQLSRYLAWAARAYPGDSSAVHSSLAFDLTVTSLFVPLLAGGRVELVDGEAPVEALARRLERGGEIGMLKLTPTHLRVLAERLEGAGLRGGARCLVVGGEALRGEELDFWRRRLPGAVLVNEYGPTETVVGCCIHARRLDGIGAGPVPIGRAAPGTQLHLLDAALAPVAGGEAGELYIGGAQVTRGYLGRPALTAERYLPDPFGGRPGARMYRTGDRVRWRETGVLEYLGRLDEQVKIRGFRVEPGEVEAALAQSPGVSACAVVARDDAGGERVLVAYVAGTARPEALRESLRGRLPEHMLPAAFVVLDRLPVTANGKVDRAALPAPRTDAAAEPPHPPLTPREQALARIWGEVLGVQAVDAETPFLALGGHSLAAFRILSRISTAFGAELPPRALLGGGSIREVAQLLEGRAAPAPAVPPLVPVPHDGPLPLALSQEAVWFFEQMVPGLLAYRAQTTVRFRGPLDVAALEAALTGIVRRHEIFRTTFPVENGGPVQRVQAPWPVRLPVHDLSGADPARREAAVREEVMREFLRPFDEAALPLVWWSLVRAAPDDHVFVMVEHHFVHDGWSFGVFLRELRALYLARLERRPSPLPEPAVQFADFAVWQRRWLESDAARAQLEYWAAELDGVPPLKLPTDFPRPAVSRFRGARERVRLPAALVRRARAFSHAQGATFFTTLLAAFQALLGRYSGQADFCVGSGVANRRQVALEEVIGMVVNSVGLRADLRGDPTGAELLRRVRERTLRAYEHQELPFDQVVRRLQPERSASTLPIYQVAFSFHDSRMAELSFAGARLEIEEAQDNGSAKHDLQVTVMPRAEQGIAELADEVVMVWEYDTDLFAPATLRRMVAHYQTLLEALLADPGRRLSALPLLGEEERRRVVEEWNRTDAPRADGRCIHHRVAEHAARTPDAVAVVDPALALSYGELDRRSARLARTLRGLGVGPEVRVGVCLPRGAELVAAWLGVLRAGGAYLPLDPGYPAERLAYMLADSGAAVLLTQASLRDAFPVPAGVRVVAVDAEVDEDAAGAEGGAAPEGGATAANLAYVIYTSGSTGKPKGVGVEHGGLANLCAWYADALGITPADRSTHLISPGFDGSVVEIWPPLSRGACVQVVPDELRTDPAGLGDWMVRHGSTFGIAPVALAEPLLALEWPAGMAMRRLVTGADRLKARPRPGLPFTVTNNYGPTEATVIVTVGPVEAEGERAPDIGRPVPNVRVYVLDEGMEPVPVGVAGELYVGGVQVARGYLGAPRATAERFVPDPFSAAPGARLYRTGDRVRWLETAGAEAVLEFLGRVDAQVKIRGFRIEPGEIEAVLRAHPAVRDCAVVAREDRPGEMRLAAYVAAEEGAATAAELRAFLRGKLPEHMVPAAFTLLPALPLNASGKVDRRTLPAPDEAREEEAFVAPATEAERGIAAIWQELLGCERVGAGDDFFDLGGDSLLATRVVVRTRELLEREVPLASLFSHRTLAAFAHAAEGSPPAAPAAAGADLLSASRMRRAAARGGSGPS